MIHSLSTYKDDYKTIQFCQRCGVEGLALFDTACKDLDHKCALCGHMKFTDEDCKNCNRIKEMFIQAIDRSKLMI